MRGKQMATIALVSHTPAHDDGLIYQNDTVVFSITGTGVISAYGSRDGQVLVSWSNTRGDLDMDLGPSLAWLAHPGPLHVEVNLRELVGHNVKTLAATSFEIAG